MSFRLVDLEPHWLMDGARRVGIAFDCPCGNCLGKGCMLAVRFANPIGGGDPTPDDQSKVGNNKGKRWTRTGESFESLTVTPSIDSTKDKDGNPMPPEHQHWHGFITNGAIA